MRLSPVHEFALKAALWLPLSFVIWFWAAPLWVWPAATLAKTVLPDAAARLGITLLPDAGDALEVIAVGSDGALRRSRGIPGVNALAAHLAARRTEDRRSWPQGC